VVFYTILDCLDGKHARRTNTSSPLGQLFDHGCDALSVNLLLANIACSLSIGCSWAHALGNLGVSSRRCAAAQALPHALGATSCASSSAASARPRQPEAGIVQQLHM
jgi:phosphatidylglycerophosphate synthase